MVHGSVCLHISNDVRWARKEGVPAGRARVEDGGGGGVRNGMGVSGSGLHGWEWGQPYWWLGMAIARPGQPPFTANKIAECRA